MSKSRIIADKAINFQLRCKDRLAAIYGVNFTATCDEYGLRASKTGSAGQSFFLYDGDSLVLAVN